MAWHKAGCRFHGGLSEQSSFVGSHRRVINVARKTESSAFVTVRESRNPPGSKTTFRSIPLGPFPYLHSSPHSAADSNILCAQKRKALVGSNQGSYTMCASHAMTVWSVGFQSRFNPLFLLHRSALHAKFNFYRAMLRRARYFYGKSSVRLSVCPWSIGIMVT